MAMSMKERWALCGQLAEKLTITKGDVFNLLSVFNERGLTTKILHGDQEAIAHAQLVHEEHMRRDAIITSRQQDRPQQRPVDPPVSALEAKANDVRLMLWAVTKIGDRERARAAFEDVMRTLKDT